MKSDINRKMVSGAGWMVGMRLGDRVIAFVSMLVLARLLMPEDFGLVGYAMAFIGILETFFDFTFQTVLIRDQDAPRQSYDTAWTLDLGKGILLTAILFLGAGAIADFFGEPEVEKILYCVAVLPFLRGLENIGIVDFQKSMRFHKDFQFNMSTRLIGTAVAITLALILRNYWALVIGSLTRSVCRVGLSYVMSPFRPRIDVSKFDRVFGFSKWLLMQNILYGGVERLPTIIVGRFHSAQAVGLFNMALELSHLASRELASPIRRALLPGVAKIREDSQHLAEILGAAIGSIGLIGLPITVGIVVAAPVIIPVLLGQNWVEIVPIVQVFGISATTYILYSNSNVVLLAMDMPRVTAFISALQAGLLFPLTLWLVPEHGALGAAWALSLTNVVIMIVDYAIVLYMTDLTMRDVLAATWRSIAGTAIMAGVVYYVMGMIAGPESGLPLVVSLVIVIAAGAVSYTASVAALWYLGGRPSGSESYLLSLVSNRLGRAKEAGAVAE